MAHYAKIENNIVTQIIRSDRPFAEALGGEWVRTSYNTNKGKHSRGNIPVRKNYAGVGYTYNRDIDAFIPPCVYRSWILDKMEGVYTAPIEYPKDEFDYLWDEKNLKWKIKD